MVWVGGRVNETPRGYAVLCAQGGEKKERPRRHIYNEGKENIAQRRVLMLRGARRAINHTRVHGAERYSRPRIPANVTAHGRVENDGLSSCPAFAFANPLWRHT